MDSCANRWCRQSQGSSLFHEFVSYVNKQNSFGAVSLSSSWQCCPFYIECCWKMLRWNVCWGRSQFVLSDALIFLKKVSKVAIVFIVLSPSNWERIQNGLIGDYNLLVRETFCLPPWLYFSFLLFIYVFRFCFFPCCFRVPLSMLLWGIPFQSVWSRGRLVALSQWSIFYIFANHAVRVLFKSPFPHSTIHQLHASISAD